MGCDIHGFVEVRDARPESLKKYRDDFVPWWTPIICVGSFLTRDYNLFGVLAGVRWYDPSWEWEPIAPNRGLPDDVSYEVRSSCMMYDEKQREWVDDEDHHSTTWMLLSEIKAFNWDKKINDQKHNPEFTQYLKKGKEEERPPMFIDNWVPLYDYCDEFKTVRRLMEELVNIYGNENVRLIIWFDN